MRTQIAATVQVFRPTNIQLRQATEKDAPTLEQLVQLAYRGGKAEVAWKNENELVTGPRTTLAELVAYTHSADDTILVAEVNGALVGCVLIEREGDHVVIGMLAVSPDCQNVGLGKTLIQAGEEHARKLNFQQAHMYVLSGRPELTGWYERLGYKPTGATKPFPIEEGGSTPANSNAHFLELLKTL